MALAPDQLRDHIDLMTSAQILDDPLLAPDALGEFEEYLRTFHNVNGVNMLDQRPETAEQRVQQDLRRCVQRVVAHRVANVLLPVTLELLSDDSPTIDRLQTEGVFEAQEWPGARYRVFEGDDAKIGAGYEKIFMSVVRAGLFECWSPEQAETLRRVNNDVTVKLQQAGANTRISEFADTPLKDLLAEEPYVGFDKNSVAPVRLRTVSFIGSTVPPSRVNNSLRPDIMDQLHTNAVGFGEFYGSSLGTMMPWTFKEDGCPPGEWFRTELGSIAPFSALAAVKDGPGGEIVYTDRGRRAFKAVEEQGRWVIEAVREPLKAATGRVKRAESKNIGQIGHMSQWSRCPSNQGLPANDTEVESMQRYWIESM